MNNKNVSLVARPIFWIAIILIAVCAAFFPMALELDGNASLLPVAMLAALVVLSVVLIMLEAKQTKEQKAVLQSPPRVFGALACVLLFVIGVDLIGFYVTTAVFVPLVSYLFGCRSIRVLLIADVVVVAGIYLIFGMAMAKSFPMGAIW